MIKKALIVGPRVAQHITKATVLQDSAFRDLPELVVGKREEEKKKKDEERKNSALNS